MKAMGSPPRGFLRSATFLSALSTAVWMLGGASIGRGELVILTDGRVIKALSHQAHGDRIEVLLPGGGSYTFDQTRVERIVDDEVTGSDVKAAPQSPRRVEGPPPVRIEPESVQATAAATATPEPAKPPSEAKPAKPGKRLGRHQRFWRPSS